MLTKYGEIKEADMSRTCQRWLDFIVNLMDSHIDRKRIKQNVDVFLHLCIFYTKKNYALLLFALMHFLSIYHHGKQLNKFEY